MKSIIEITGSAKDLTVTAVLAQRYTSRIGENNSINFRQITSDGFDCAVSLLDYHLMQNCIIRAGSGMQSSVDIELSHRWQKHNLKSNVKINNYCTKGFFASLLVVMVGKFKGATGAGKQSMVRSKARWDV